MSYVKTNLRSCGAVAAVLLWLMAPSAEASYVKFCDGSYSTHTNCRSYQEGMRRLTAVSAVAQDPSNAVVCAGAYDRNTNPYGSLICASHRACHTYGGGNDLYGRVHSHDDRYWDIWMWNYGLMYWNQTLSDCPAGGYLAKRSALGVEGPTTSSEEDRCIRLPDVDGDGVACAEPNTVAREGLLAALVPQHGEGEGVVLGVLPPEGATAATVTVRGKSRSIKTHQRRVSVLHVKSGDISVQWRGGPATSRTLEFG